MPQTQPAPQPTVQQVAGALVPDAVVQASPQQATTASRPAGVTGVPAENAVLGADGLTLPPIAPGSVLNALVSRALAEIEPLRAVRVSFQDLRGIDLLAYEQAEPQLIRFNIPLRGDDVGMEDLQRTLRSSAFAGQLDRLRSEMQDELQLDRSVTITVAGMSLGLSLVYVLWLIRGGVLMGSYLSALPAWRVLDPLPVLSRVDEEAEEDDEALDAVAERPGNPLRSFG